MKECEECVSDKAMWGSYKTKEFETFVSDEALWCSYQF